MIRPLCLIVLLLGYCAASFARFDRISQCERICAVGMSAECCECIGCHQAMRFGKRALPLERSLGVWSEPRYRRGGAKRRANPPYLLDVFPVFSVVMPRNDK